jgi:hypothetical protein
VNHWPDVLHPLLAFGGTRARTAVQHDADQAGIASMMLTDDAVAMILP